MTTQIGWLVSRPPSCLSLSEVINLVRMGGSVNLGARHFGGGDRPGIRNGQRFRGGLLVKAHRLCVSLKSRLESNKEEEERLGVQMRTTQGERRIQSRQSQSPLIRPKAVARLQAHAPQRRGAHQGTVVQLLHRNVKRFRGGLVFKAHRWLYPSTLGSRVIKKKKRKNGGARSLSRANGA